MISCKKEIFRELTHGGKVRLMQLINHLKVSGTKDFIFGDIFVFKDEEISLIGALRDGQIIIDKITFDHSSSPDDTISFEEIEQYLRGKHPITIWREHRRMTKTELSDIAGVSKSYLSDLENMKKPGTLDVLSKIATALNVDVQDIVR